MGENWDPVNLTPTENNSPFSSLARKRARQKQDLNLGPASVVNVPEPDVDDPDYLELLKLYEEDDDYDVEKEREEMRKSSAPTIWTQSLFYFCVIGSVLLFIVVINSYNSRQLERLKIEYGLDEKHFAPDIWWQKSLIYRILVKSFFDSNEDGIGDLNGIRKHMDHLVYLGADAVLLCPIFDSPHFDLGRDTTDFTSIHPDYGTMESFQKLVDELHEKNIKILLEVDPNQTSKRHRWFQQSRQGGVGNTYRDMYIWHPGHTLSNGSTTPPNNWMSEYGGSAWSWDDMRGQYYYHHYHTALPDLNHHNPHVKRHFLDIFKFWLEKGVDGFLLTNMKALFETEDVMLDEPLSETPGIQPGEYGYLDHLYTEDQPEIHEQMASWREFIDAHCAKTDSKIAFLVDAGDDSIDDITRYYHTGADATLTRVLRGGQCGGHCVHEKIDAWLSHIPDEKDSLWMLGGPDLSRSTEQRGPLYHNILTMLSLLLPGAAITYYGEEIGLPPSDVPYSQLTDPLAHQAGPERYLEFARDPSRGPMPWTRGRMAAFTTGDRPWLPLTPHYQEVNVETQMEDLSGNSPLQLYYRLAHVRKEVSFLSGKMQFAVINENIFSFMRFAKDNAPYLITMNFGTEVSVDDYSMITGVPVGKVVAHAKPNLLGEKSESKGRIRDNAHIKIDKLRLEPGEGVLLLLMMEIEFDSEF